MDLKSFLLRRLLLSIFVIFGLSMLIFVITRIVPGDPVRMALGTKAPYEVVQELRQEMHLDKSLPEQYFYWIRGAFSGDFGRCLTTKRSVVEDIKQYLPATAELAIFSGLLMVIFAVIFGTLAAQYKDTWVDNLIRILCYFGVSIPSFVAAIILLLLFAYQWPILPVMGRLTSGIIPPTRITGLLILDSLIQRNFVTFWDAFKHLILPSVSLAVRIIFMEARIIRSTMVSNLGKEFIQLERGYGIPERVVMAKYLLKPSLIPVVSLMGLAFSSMFANAFLVEMIYGWPGLSRYGIEAMLGKDLNVISAVIILVGIVFVVINIIVDIFVGFMDPRIRLRASASGGILK